jgi:glycosyltransferase involved in cell wall biosynthesis
MKKIYISAIYISPPNTMGGNTKIIIELINNLVDYYNFIIFTTEPETFKKNINNPYKIKIITVPYNFKKFSFSGHLKEIDYIFNFYEEYFKLNQLELSDYFYSASDFAPDVIPIFKLKKEYNFKWIASLYLFIPSPFENLFKKYNFPFFKYIIYYFYQRYLFLKILDSFDLCLITNEEDKKYFPQIKKSNILAVYGGVNIEQIESACKKYNHNNKYESVFCGRLHPQKGISQLLDIWKIVVKERPESKLGIIGNGEKKFEKFLKKKSKRLNIDSNIAWLGYINNEDKYNIYLQSKLLVHSTIYDNNGMVAAEALCSGLPVVMYDLTELKFYNTGCLKIKIGDKTMYAKEIIELISNQSYYNFVKPDYNAISSFKKFWSWENRADLFKTFLENYEKNIT